MNQNLHGIRFGQVDVPDHDVAALSMSPPGRSRASVVVLPGIHGRTPHILDVGQRLAASGYHAIIADFYCTAARTGGLRTPADIGAATETLDHDAITESVIGLLDRQPVQPVAVIGYCVGGAVALQVAARSDSIAAVVVYYAVLRADQSDSDDCAPLRAAAELNCPVLAHYGTTDVWCPPSDVDEFEARLATSASAYQVYRYPGAGHAFEEFGRPGYRPVAASEAAGRSLVFLDHYLSAASAAASLTG